MTRITKSITITQSDFILRKIADEQPEIRTHLSHFTEFDREGRTLKDIRYMKDGSFEEKVEYSYDESGKLITEKYYQEEDFISEEIRYQYNTGDLATVASRIYADGSVDSIIFEYDPQGLLLKKVYKNEDQEIEQTDVYTYDDRVLVKVEAFDGEGNLMSIPFQDETLSSQTRITKNEAGQVIVEEELDMNGDVIMSVNRSYMEDGHPLETEVFIDGQGKTISRHYILHYDYAFYD
jgi:antitoxin component YwqK of YwqJK toxin-antitoxin module